MATASYGYSGTPMPAAGDGQVPGEPYGVSPRVNQLSGQIYHAPSSGPVAANAGDGTSCPLAGGETISTVKDL
jgi:hypothetical protein